MYSESNFRPLIFTSDDYQNITSKWLLECIDAKSILYYEDVVDYVLEDPYIKKTTDELVKSKIRGFYDCFFMLRLENSHT